MAKSRKCFIGKSLSMVVALFLLLYSVPVLGVDETAPPGMADKLQKHISLDLRDMNVIDVYKFLAVKGDFNISISKNIKGRITLFLSDVTIKDTLDIITISNNLGYKYVGNNIIHVMTEEEYISMYGERFSDMREVKIVYLKYAKPAYILEALKNIKSDVGKIVIDSDTGSLVLIDTKENIQRMESAINSMDHPLEMKIYNLKYADAEDVAKKLRKELDNKSVGTVEADPRSNKLIIKAFPDRMKEIEDMINAVDIRTKAVLIEVSILKVKINPKLNTGVDWQSVFKRAKYLAFNGSFPIAAAAADTMTLAVGNYNVNDWQAEIELQKEVIATKVLANPSIMVTNNKEARIHIGDKLAYVTTTTIGAGDTQRTNEEIHYIDVGVQFKVTPVINDDGVITMQIVPEISSRTGTLETPQGAEVPLINSTLVETNVLVNDGQTIIIGGLKETNKSDDKQGIPYLMDVPVLGNLFSSTTNDDYQSEIVILLTPHIIKDKENYVDRVNKAERTVLPDKKY